MIIHGWKFVPGCVFNSRRSFSFTRYGYKDMKISQMNYELTIPQHPSSIIRPRKQNVKLTLIQDFIALNWSLILICSINYYLTFNRIL